jgi:hypothetical protein
MAGSTSTGRLVVAPGVRWNGIKVFSSTMVEMRNSLGEAVSAWIASHPKCRVTEFIVTQSSDSRFHCLTITVCYSEKA